MLMHLGIDGLTDLILLALLQGMQYAFFLVKFKGPCQRSFALKGKTCMRFRYYPNE